MSYPKTYTGAFLEDWSKVTEIRKPIIAAVNGFAVYVLLILIQYVIVSIV